MKRLKLPMFWATAVVVTFGLAVAAMSSWILGLIVFGALPGTLTPGPAAPGSKMTWLDPVKVALTVAAGIGGAVALVVAYRKQRMAERQELSDARQMLEAAYVTAAAQLGDASPTVRLAGVYAMANLADSWPDRQQQCVDVLCAYLRVPWSPDADIDHPLASKVVELETDCGKTTYAYPDHRGEVEVRRTISRIIGDHLKSSSSGLNWVELELDLTGATLPSLDWRGATVPQYASFEGATFSGDAKFDLAVFRGTAKFNGVSFRGNAEFHCVSFRGRAEFNRVTFDGDAKFTQAEFTDAATFHLAVFRRTTLWFEAVFSGSARFNLASFQCPAWFSSAVFRGTAWFGMAMFRSMASFREVSFCADAEFDRVSFTGTADFSQAKFSANAKFDLAEFTGGRRVDGAIFSGRERPSVLQSE